MPLFRRSPETLVALAMLALMSGCSDSPTGPRPLGPGVLAPGSIVDGTIASVADTAHFSLVLTGNKGAVVYLMAKGDLLRLDVRDSTGKLVGGVSDEFNPTNPERRSTAIIPASPSRYFVALSMVQGTAPSDYEIRVVAASDAPEHVSPVLTVGAVVSGEDLDHAYDVDSFTVTVDHDQLVDLYLRKMTHSAPTITARLSAGDVYYAIGTSAEEADTVLGVAGSGRFTLTAGVRYTIRVGYNITYDPPDTGSTPYEMLLKEVNTAPEDGPSALVAGDTVHEAIDYLGDLDEFTLSGAPGAKFNLFAEAGGSAPHRIKAQLIAGTASGLSVTALTGAPLATNATGVFTLPSNGTMTIRVTDDAPNSERGHVGPYRLLAYPIDSGTESTTADLALDRATSGALDLPGDVDVYRLTVATDTAVNIVAMRPKQGSLVGLTFTLRDAAGTTIAASTLGYVPTPGDTVGLGTRTLHPGNYTLTVATSSLTGGVYTGAYEILPRSINRAPESRPSTIAVGDTIRGESLDVAGDIDRFAVTLNAGDSVYVYLKPASADVHVGAGIRRISDDTFFGIDAYNYTTGSSVQWRSFVAPTAGEYAVEVSGETAGVDQGETGGYTVALPRISAAPEDRSATIALGDTVASSIEATGDVDDYTLFALPGTEITGALGSLADCPYCTAMSVIDPATGAVLKQSTNNGFEGFGRATVPAGGVVRVRISNSPSCGGSCVGYWPTSYRFWVVPVNRAPENHAATFAIGDTVSGEAIDPFGDIDEFTFAATAGDTVNLYFQTPLGTWGYDGLTIALVDRTTGATLGTLSDNNPSANLEDVALTRVVLPSSGIYLIRVEGTNDWDNKGLFRFRVARPGQ